MSRATDEAQRAANFALRSIAHLPAHQLEHPWPFLLSVVDGALVRNVPPAPAPKKKAAKKKPRMDWCRGWALNAQLVAAGLKPNRHQWPHDAYGDGTDRCLLCKRERWELWAAGSGPEKPTAP